MTKSTITRERLEENVQAVFDLKVGYRLGFADIEILKRVARMALAALDSEPVAEVVSVFGDSESIGERELKLLVGIQNMPCGTKFYRHAQPAPETEREPIAWLNDAYLARGVVDGEAGSEDAGPGYIPVYREASPAPVAMDDTKLRELFDSWFASDCSFDLSPEASEADNIAWRESYWYVWQRCRAAMLQAGTLTNEDTKQAWTGIPDIDNAINMLDRIDTLESCDDDRIEAVKTVLRRLAGSSPVIPDGYVMVPKEPTAKMYDAGDQQMATKQVWDAMLAAAPQPQNAPQNIPEIIPGWVPVSERMPEGSEEVLCAKEFDGPGDWRRKVGYLLAGKWTVYGASWTPTHWMPLPASPQEVK